ncbi:DUF1294 domain-containing protein [Luteimonas saliphila]|uniref:DUF1294 domain-containing protein n=1 Tax=Luteimonas saliphila TaxID=2804919 RepID=UPI00192D64FE|nr:DUF1294 domain-containing protein [Luteimonas saliphila]
MPQLGRLEQWNDARGYGFVRRLATAAAVAVLAGGWLLGAWPGVVPLFYAALALVSFLAYRHDKLAAERGRRRTPERTLHALDLAGGWPGGLLAQQVFRHKSSKRSFQVVFWTTVLMNCAAFAWLLREGVLAHLAQASPWA